MEFAAPQYGWLALTVLLVLFLSLRGERIRGRELRNFAEPHLLPRLLAPERRRSGIITFWPAAVLLLLVLALMRPQWGIIEEEQTASGIDVIFALDLSRSMLADDVAPSRLAAAKAAVAQALPALPGDRVGLIGFAGSAFLLCPLTSDHEMVARVVDEAGIETLPRGGTALAAALVEAQRGFRNSPAKGRLLVLLTDGEDHAGELAPALSELRKQGVAVIASLVGTASGGLMPLGDGSFVKDRSGAVVKSAADLASLRLLDAAAFPLAADGSTLRQRIDEVRRRGGETVRKERRLRLRERYHVPLAAALAIWLPGLFFGRRGAGP